MRVLQSGTTPGARRRTLLTATDTGRSRSLEARFWVHRLHMSLRMSSSISRRLQDWCLSLFSLSFVLACLAIINDTIRKYVLDALHGEFSTIVPDARVHVLTRHVTDMLPSSNPALLTFGAVALVLTIIMFRV